MVEHKVRVAKTIKSVPLEKEQYEALRRIFSMEDLRKDAVRHIMDDLLEECLKEQQAAWDKLAKLCGYRDWYDVREHRCEMSIDWFARCVHVREKQEREDGS